jgi:hypothetical protein
MSEAVLVLTSGNKRLEIYRDEDPENPRECWDNLGTMYCFHRRYHLGDKHGFSAVDAETLENSPESISIPIYMYDHGGVTLRSTPFGCRWDSGKLGFISVTKKKVRKEYGWKLITKSRRERIWGCLRAEIEVYDMYLQNECYGYKLFVDGIETESCWGFYGHDHKKSGLFEQSGWKEDTTPE